MVMVAKSTRWNNQACVVFKGHQMSNVSELVRDNPLFASLDAFHMQRLSEMD